MVALKIPTFFWHRFQTMWKNNSSHPLGTFDRSSVHLLLVLCEVGCDVLVVEGYVVSDSWKQGENNRKWPRCSWPRPPPAGSTLTLVASGLLTRFSRVQLFVTPRTVCSPPGSFVHGFSRQEHWSGLPFPSPGDLPHPGTGRKLRLLRLLHWQVGSLPLAPPGKPVKLRRVRGSWAPKNWCFWTAVLEKTLESPLDCKEIQPVHSKGDQPWVFFGRNDAKAETPILWPPHVKSWLIGKDSEAGRDWGQEEKGTTEDEMAEWHHWLDGHEFEWTSGVGDGQGGLACCDSWGRKESDMTERLNGTELRGTRLSWLVWRKHGVETLRSFFSGSQLPCGANLWPSLRLCQPPSLLYTIGH